MGYIYPIDLNYCTALGGRVKASRLLISARHLFFKGRVFIGPVQQGGGRFRVGRRPAGLLQNGSRQRLRIDRRQRRGGHLTALLFISGQFHCTRTVRRSEDAAAVVADRRIGRRAAILRRRRGQVLTFGGDLA
jgi:hypothetical protein